MRSSSSSNRKKDAGVARHELIGLEVAVRSRHAGWDGLSGRVVDETKHTFLVEAAGTGRETLVPKAGQVFTFRVGDRSFEVRGDEITFRPEDRTKKVRG